MPRIIFRCPYLKGGTEEAAAHLENYVGYVATRDGVERIDPGRAHLPATQKQRAMVQKLLREFPLSKGMFEYADYLAVPTRGNASEFITRAIEDNLDSLSKRENYLDYIAKRPRAQRMGPHGLFTGAEDALVLSQVAKKVAEHPGNVWLPIISLRREDAARLGYDSAESWRALLSSYAMELAKNMKIPWDQFRWYAAYHDAGHHPHVHMVCYSADPSKGYLTKDGIAKIKADLAGQIFRQELTELYTRQTQRRTELTAEAQAVMERLIRQMQDGVLESGRIEQLTAHLAQRLKFTTGKKQYGYLKAPLKSMVDEIVDELAKDSRVAEAYRLWYELRDEVLRTYRNDLRSHLPLSQQKEFKKIKNLVIQEAMRLGTLTEIPEEAEQEELPLPEEPPEPSPEEDSPCWEEPPLPDAPPPEAPSPEEVEEAEPSVSWSDRYKKARQYLYGGEDRPPDFERAHALFLEEARSGNALAMHDLGRMFKDGLTPGREIDTEQAQAWYAKALAAFLSVEQAKPGRYTEYRIGKLYAAGLGTEQNHTAAAGWFAMAAEKGHKYAQNSLAGLYSRGQGVDQDHQEAHRLYAASAEQGFPYAAFELGKQLRDGVGCDADADAAALWFTQAYGGFRTLEKQSHDDKLQYRIGWMHLHGVGADQDEPQARAWFEKAARLGNSQAQYQLAKLILADSAATADQVAEALSWLTKAAEAGQDCAQYALGKLYRNGRGEANDGPMEKDIAQAVAWFIKAAEQDNDYAAFALGKLYLEGKEQAKEIPSALRWLRRAAELGNQFAQYRLGKLLLSGEDIPKDVEGAVRWLTASADQGNQFAQYALGRLFLKGEEVPKDTGAAIRWLEAAAQENAFAEYALGMVYLKGEDTPKDLARALPLLTHAAEQGNQYAQYRLGRLLLSGEGIPKDVESALRWLTASADQGNQFAQYTLGKLYLLGKDVPRDKEAATRWFTMAAEQGNEYAQFFLDHMNDPFGPTLLQTATRLLHHLGNLFRDQSPPPSGSGGMHIAVDKKLLRKIREKKMAQGHKADDHKPTMTL